MWVTDVYEAYLYEIRKAKSPICCGAAIDSTVHTFLHCPSWAVERGNLFVALGLNLDLDREYNLVIGAIMGSSEAWTAFANFCETVVRRKEEAEGDREGNQRELILPPVPSVPSRVSPLHSGNLSL